MSARSRIAGRQILPGPTVAPDLPDGPDGGDRSGLTVSRANGTREPASRSLLVHALCLPLAPFLAGLRAWAMTSSTELA
jgi:hypothetical protein